MPTPPISSVANADSLAERTALEAVANAQFIDQSAIAIENAIAQGKYWVVLTTFENCNILNLQNYYKGLGYCVIYPDRLNPNVNPWNPAELFGQDYFDYWNHGGWPPNMGNPVRIRLEWQIP